MLNSTTITSRDPHSIKICINILDNYIIGLVIKHCTKWHQVISIGQMPLFRQSQCIIKLNKIAENENKIARWLLQKDIVHVYSGREHAKKI